MSASWPGSMRGPWAKTPVLLLLLLLLSTLTRTVLCQTEGEEETEPVTPDVSEDDAAVDDPEVTEGQEGAPTEASPTDATDPPASSGQPEPDEGSSGEGSASAPIEDPTASTDPPIEPLNPIIILIPVVLVVLIIAMIVCGIVINRRWNNKARDQGMRKEDPYLDGSSSEKVPMPMFEEDVPSVLELEMDELDQWMKKDGETAEDSKHT